MRLRSYQWGELIGMLLLFASSAAQIFYVEPLKREIEWRLAAFNMQQNAQVQTKAIYDARLSLLKAVNAPASALAESETERTSVMEKYKTADANISDFLTDKKVIEDYLQMIVIALFALGTVLAGVSRIREMRGSHTRTD